MEALGSLAGGLFGTGAGGAAAPGAASGLSQIIPHLLQNASANAQRGATGQGATSAGLTGITPTSGQMNRPNTMPGGSPVNMQLIEELISKLQGGSGGGV